MSNADRPAYRDLVEWEGQPAQVGDVCDGVASLTLLDGTHRMVPVERLAQRCRFRPSRPPWPSQMCATCGEWRDDHSEAPDA